jgi:hypothetical protein
MSERLGFIVIRTHEDDNNFRPYYHHVSICTPHDVALIAMGINQASNLPHIGIRPVGVGEEGANHRAAHEEIAQ